MLNKPAGVSVMGERHETDLVRMAAGAGEELFPVHRIDKVTSGAVLFAKELRWHGPLTRQFAARTVGKTYLAITGPGGLPARGVIDLPLSTGRKSRVRVAAPRASIVADAVQRHLVGPGVRGLRARADLPVGHRLRHRVAGRAARAARRPPGHRPPPPDPGSPGLDRPPGRGRPAVRSTGAPRTLLHSWRLAFDAAWRGGSRVQAEAAPGPDFWALVTGRLPGPDPAALLASAPAPPEPPPPGAVPGARPPAAPARPRPAGERRRRRRPPGSPPPR